MDLVFLEREYNSEGDWYVKENANVNKSYSSFIGYMLDKILSREETLSQIIPGEYVAMHSRGDIHIHKLPHSLYIPYCNGWMFSTLLRKGLKTASISARPAKRLSTAVSHLVTFLFLASQEFTGAQAVSAVDLYLGAFAGMEKLKEDKIKQATQRLIYELNYPSRLGFQSPFTNITIMLDTIPSFLGMDAIVGGRTVGRLGDFLDEARLVVEGILEHYMEGDADGRPFTFPLVTMMFTKNFDWNGERWGGLTDKIFELISKRGTIYILNGYATNVEALYALCCRLTIDMSELTRIAVVKPEVGAPLDEIGDIGSVPRAVWAVPDATGSIGVVTINLPRLAFISSSEDEFMDRLYDRVETARRILGLLRNRYRRSMENGLVPITRIYLGHYNFHFSTIGLIGIPEALANIVGDEEYWVRNDGSRIKRDLGFIVKVVRTIRKICREYQEEDGYLYNVEEVPGESTAYRLAMKDLELSKKTGRRACIPTVDGIPFYSNSIVPYYADVGLIDRIEMESLVQQEFTGGVMMHIFLGEAADPKALRKLVERIVKNTKIVYFSITPNITRCLDCGRSIVGVSEKCPYCGGKTEVWSRIVGYYRPLSNWNIGRVAEFKTRVNYTINGEAIVGRKPSFYLSSR